MSDQIDLTLKLPDGPASCSNIIQAIVRTTPETHKGTSMQAIRSKRSLGPVIITATA